VFDDLEYLKNSDFFNKNKNILYEVNNYDHIFQDENKKKKPIKIEYNSSSKSNLSIKSFDDETFEEIFDDDNYTNLNTSNLNASNLEDLIDMSSSNILENNSKTTTIKSTSTCSSRTSYTSSENSDDKESEEEDVDELETDELEKEEWEDMDEDDEEDIEETIEATIPQFPVQVIGMEYCENTFDDLILSDELKDKNEWFSAFMQIIMILITYQKTFAFTHNDLHTNNVMYNTTDKKFLYYCYKKNITKFQHLVEYSK
jgi:hypothetical protein